MSSLRRPGTISAAVLVALVLTFAAAHTIAPEWTHRVGMDVWNLPAMDQQLRQAQEGRDEILELEQKSMQRREAANRVAWKLIDGMPLTQAADELLILFQDDQGVIITLESNFPNTPSRRHLFALHAIDRAKRFLKDPQQYQSVVTRLEEEYKSIEATGTSSAH